jgi:hypothetical protein
MKNETFVPFILLILVLLGACRFAESPEIPEEQLWLRIKGNVKDATSGNPVTAACVCIGQGMMGWWNSTATDDQGRYAFETYVSWNTSSPPFLLVYVTGYKSSLKVPLAKTEEWQTRDVQLTPESTE